MREKIEGLIGHLKNENFRAGTKEADAQIESNFENANFYRGMRQAYSIAIMHLKMILEGKK